MKTLDEVIELVEGMNDSAHQDAWDTWISADEASDEGDDELAEELREEASEAQADSFRELYWDLDSDDQAAIRHWLEQDSDFREQFAVYFGEQYFEDEFDDIGD